LVKSIKCDIFIQLEYNNKKPIEKEKFLQTYEELSCLFGGCSIDENIILGKWIEDGTTYDDKLRPYQIHCKKDANNIQLLCNYKEKLKCIFEQIEIFMYYIDVYHL
jgi:hypothetical protein